MISDASCRSCRFWSRLRAGALIGRCGNNESRHAFPKANDCCELWSQTRHRTWAELDVSDLPPARPGRPRKRPAKQP